MCEQSTMNDGDRKQFIELHSVRLVADRFRQRRARREIMGAQLLFSPLIDKVVNNIDRKD
jgi:hypothetical protein